MDNQAAKPEAIGRRIILLRKALGYESATAFAAYLGVSPQKLWNWESGNARPDVSGGLNICNRTGVTLDWLFRDMGTTLPKNMFDLLYPPKAD